MYNLLGAQSFGVDIQGNISTTSNLNISGNTILRNNTTCSTNLNVVGTITSTYNNVAQQFINSGGTLYLQYPSMIYMYNSGSTGRSFGVDNTGQIMSAFPVNIEFYGAQTIYDSSQVSRNPQTTTGGFYFYKWSSYRNQNWTPTYSNTTQLQIPYTGLYMCQMTCAFSNTCVIETFINKNLSIASTSYLGDSGTFAIMTQTSAYTGFQGSLSCTMYLTTTDVLNFGSVLDSGTLSNNARSSLQLTLIQRTA
jgi:hypothetical protein